MKVFLSKLKSQSFIPKQIATRIDYLDFGYAGKIACCSLFPNIRDLVKTKHFRSEDKIKSIRGVGLIRTMEIVKKSSELARSSKLARPCGFKSFDLKNEFLLRIAN